MTSQRKIGSTASSGTEPGTSRGVVAKASSEAPREASLRARLLERRYQLIAERDVWFAEIGGTRFGPLRTLDEIERFLAPEAPPELPPPS